MNWSRAKGLSCRVLFKVDTPLAYMLLPWRVFMPCLVYALSLRSIRWTLHTEVCATWTSTSTSTRLISFQSHRAERPVWTPVLFQATVKARAARGTVVSIMKDVFAHLARVPIFIARVIISIVRPKSFLRRIPITGWAVFPPHARGAGRLWFVTPVLLLHVVPPRSFRATCLARTWRATRALAQIGDSCLLLHDIFT